MELNREQIIEYINEFEIKSTKSNGQNFLCNPDFASKIVLLLDAKTNDKIVEVGPGLGSLTYWLKDYKNVTSIEVDRQIFEVCNFLYKNTNILFVNNDALNVNFDEYNKIISNIPYSISTELLEHIFSTLNNAEKAVFMCQSEFVDRICAKNGKEYGPLNVYISLLGTIKKEFVIPNNCFFPQPKCRSTVFTIKFAPRYSFKETYEIYKLTKKLFLNRRKTILNNLSQIITRDLAVRVLEENHILQTRRPEELKPIEFCNIFFSLKNR